MKPTQENNTFAVTADIVRPILSRRFSKWLTGHEHTSPADVLESLVSYAYVKGTTDITEAEVERIVWAVTNIRSRAAWLDEVVKGESAMIPQWRWNPISEECENLEPSFFSVIPSLVERHRYIINAQGFVLEVVKGGARRPKGGDDDHAA